MSRPRALVLTSVVLALAAGCASSVPDPEAGEEAPDAAPIARDLARAAKQAGDPAPTENRSPSRVIAYVDGDVVTYRDVLLEVGPQLAVLESQDEKDRLEQQVLLSILEDRVLYRAAQDAKVEATRDEVEDARSDFVAKLKKNGGTLDAYLSERGMTRRELDDRLKREIVLRKYTLAAIGLSSDAKVRVRPVTDPYVSPAEIRKYYDRHPERFREPASAKYRVLTIPTDFGLEDRAAAFADAKKRAEAVLVRLQNGEDWVPVFREVSGPDAEAYHEDGLVEIRHGQKSPWIEEFAFGHEKGALKLEESGTTCYILRAEGSHEERVVPFEERQVDIRRMLLDARRTMAGFEVELALLDEASIRPEALKARLRDSLRTARMKVMTDTGL